MMLHSCIHMATLGVKGLITQRIVRLHSRLFLVKNDDLSAFDVVSFAVSGETCGRPNCSL